MNTQEFNRVLITKFNDRASKYLCDNEKGYKQYIKENPDMCENIGEYGHQIKPVFDVDAFDAEPDIDEIIADIQKQIPGRSVNYAKREVREYKGKMKYSYRFYVDGVGITSKNLKASLIENEFNKSSIYDMRIYDKNKVLFLPLTTKKTDTAKVPLLIPKLMNVLILNAVLHISKMILKIGMLKCPLLKNQTETLRLYKKPTTIKMNLFGVGSVNLATSLTSFNCDWSQPCNSSRIFNDEKLFPKISNDEN
jgi:hypothetical protein